MLGLIFYVIFSALFTLGVTHKGNDSSVVIIMKAVMSILFGWIMMPFYLGSWFDLNNIENVNRD
jgi:hypothetical protein